MGGDEGEGEVGCVRGRLCMIKLLLTLLVMMKGGWCGRVVGSR